MTSRTIILVSNAILIIYEIIPVIPCLSGTLSITRHRLGHFRQAILVQKFIVLTGHITDALITIVGAPTWAKLSDADKQIFETVLKEGAARATAEIIEIEKKLGAEFEKRGKTVVKVDRTPFRGAVVKLHNGPDATWDKATYDKLQALK